MGYVVGWYLLISIGTFSVYGVDKYRARTGGWRIPEKTLHLLSLAGGWPGAWTAQRTLRHKTRKPAFQIIFWLSVLLHVGCWIGWSLRR
jgi:uncharacterized membrane protein YsdA (DUF1294 family)